VIRDLQSTHCRSAKAAFDRCIMQVLEGESIFIY